MLTAVWILACVIWSSMWLAIKIGVGDVPPFGFATLRLALALSLLGPIALWRRAALTAADVRLIAQTGALLLGANYALLYWGEQYISSGLAAMLQATTPLFGIAMGRLLGTKERATRREVAALCVGVVGVALVFWPEIALSQVQALAGIAAVLAGAACVAWAYVRVRQQAHRVDRVTLMAGQMVAGLLVLLPLTIFTEGNPLAVQWSARTVSALVYLVIAGSLVASWLNYWLLARMPVRRVLLMAVAEPLLAVAMGALVLGERLHRPAAVGAVLIVAATYFSLARNDR